jgi:hypothetical protein
MAVAVSLSLFFALLIFGALLYWMRRVRAARRCDGPGLRKLDKGRLVGKAFSADEEEYDAPPFVGSKEPCLVPLRPEQDTTPALRARVAALQVAASVPMVSSSRRGLLRAASGGERDALLLGAAADVDLPVALRPTGEPALLNSVCEGEPRRNGASSSIDASEIQPLRSGVSESNSWALPVSDGYTPPPSSF